MEAYESALLGLKWIKNNAMIGRRLRSVVRRNDGDAAEREGERKREEEEEKRKRNEHKNKSANKEHKPFDDVEVEDESA